MFVDYVDLLVSDESFKPDAFRIFFFTKPGFVFGKKFEVRDYEINRSWFIGISGGEYMVKIAIFIRKPAASLS